MYTLKLCDYELDELKKIIDKRYYELRDEMHTLEGIAEQIEDEIYCVDECEKNCDQENKYECKHFQEHQKKLEETGCCECCSCKNEENHNKHLTT